jgi:riboflavin synthase
MFTGIIIATGRLATIAEHGGDLELGIEAAALDMSRMTAGDSVSVQGVCLTATRIEGSVFHADVSRETLAKTTLGSLKPGARLNLEPSLRAGDALGGHLVSGHVDAVGRVASVQEDARSRRLRFELPKSLMRFVAAKGSICIDGVSLTVNEVEGQGFGVNIIPHTSEMTTLGGLSSGDGVNVEIDVIARYIDRLLPVSAGYRPHSDDENMNLRNDR